MNENNTEQNSDLYRLESERIRAQSEKARIRSQDYQLTLKVIGAVAATMLFVSGVVTFFRPSDNRRD